MGPGFISFVFILHSLSQQISFVVGWFGCLFFLFLNSNRPMLVQMKKKDGKRNEISDWLRLRHWQGAPIKFHGANKIPRRGVFRKKKDFSLIRSDFIWSYGNFSNLVFNSSIWLCFVCLIEVESGGGLIIVSLFFFSFRYRRGTDVVNFFLSPTDQSLFFLLNL